LPDGEVQAGGDPVVASLLGILPADVDFLLPRVDDGLKEVAESAGALSLMLLRGTRALWTARVDALNAKIRGNAAFRHRQAEVEAARLHRASVAAVAAKEAAQVKRARTMRVARRAMVKYGAQKPVPRQQPCPCKPGAPLFSKCCEPALLAVDMAIRAVRAAKAAQPVERPRRHNVRRVYAPEPEEGPDLEQRIAELDAEFARGDRVAYRLL
jgi:hypothetical protein